MAGTSLSVVSKATANRGGVPAWVSTPEVRGKNEVDRKLSVKVMQSMWTYTPTLKWMRPTLSWQWKRDGAAITGATDPVYVTTNADLGKAITCTVTLTGENGSASVTTGSTFKSLNFNTSDPNGTFFTDEATYSNTIGASTITTSYDLKALGVLKTSKTTGTIIATETKLVVASASGFTIGDKIIVATGGEAGAGAIGTKGVGGTYPALSYVNATAMNADTTQADGKLCWLESTGYVWYWNAAGPAWVQVDTDLFYIARAIPKALLATITNIVGTTITLNTAASVTATNANVYFDNKGKFDPYLDYNSGATRAAKRIYVSAGEYAFSGSSSISNSMKDVLFEGDGSTQTLFIAPDGCANISLGVTTVQRSIFRKFGLVGNHKLNSWCRSGFDETSWYNSFTQGFATGIRAVIGSDVLFDDIHVTDMENRSITGDVLVDSCTRNCYGRFSAPIRVYVQWVFNYSDSSSSGVLDCEVDSDWAMPAIELFGGGYGYLIRFTGRNCYLSVNSVTDWFVDTPDITWNAGSAYNYNPATPGTLSNWSPFGTILNFNTNINNQQGRADPTATGTCLNPRIVVEGMMNNDVNGRNKPIVVAPGFANVMVKGGYIEVPEQQSGSWTIQAVACDGDGMTVSGVRVVGCSVSGDRAMDTSEASGYGRVVDCVGENIKARVNQRNQTNAAYTAAGGS